MNKNEIKEIDEIFRKHQLYYSRMISFSKSFYRENFPNNEVYFNANIFIIDKKKAHKIWYGDLDLTIDEKVLKKIAKEIKYDLYILREMDGRFGNENLTPEKVLLVNIKTIHQTKQKNETREKISKRKRSK